MGREVEAGLRELLTFFGVDQCGILEIQPDMRQARLAHHAYVEGVSPVPTTIDYGAFFPWTHERGVMQGKMFVQTCIDDLPPDAVIDRASFAAFGLEACVNVPVGLGGRITHVLALVSSRPMGDWPEPILARLQMIAETFLATLSRNIAEQALERSERSLAGAQRIAGVGSYVRDWASGALTGSDEANRILGVALGEAVGDVLEFVHPEDRAQVEEATERTLASRAPSSDLEYRIVRADGTVRTIRSRTETAYAPDGTPQRTLGTIQDISELRAAEQESQRLRVELRHADRAAHVGALTASLSHELNQPLMGILANSQAALRLLGQGDVDPGDLREILESIVRDDKRAAAVIGNLRTLLRREEPPRAKFDIADAIAEVMTIFKSELESRHVRLEIRLEPDCVAWAVRTQIQQVMLNLLSNAVQGLPEVPAADRRLRVALSRIGDDRVEVSVQDNAVGIPADRLGRIFEPFFTTRSDGLGMGLAIARSIVETHGGEIDAQNHEEGGATFRFSLPVEPPASDAGVKRAAQEGSTDRHPRAYDGEATVCVVDDDPAIREGVARLLGAAGWRAVTFDSAAAALASAELASAHCVVLDVQMPGMSGSELQAELARRAFDAPVVFLTARGDAATGVDAIKHGAIEYLCKPVDDGVLIGAVRKALDRHAEHARSVRERASVEERLARLTLRERDVLREVIAGRLNKQIAAELSITEATVKQHRGQVMDKLEVRSVAELVRLCQVAGFPDA